MWNRILVVAAVVLFAIAFPAFQTRLVQAARPVAAPVVATKPTFDEQAAAKLIVQLGDTNSQTRDRATQQLTALGEPAIAFLEASAKKPGIDAEQKTRLAGIVRAIRINLLPKDKTEGKNLTAAITELTVFAESRGGQFVGFTVRLTNTAQADVNVTLKEVDVSLDAAEKGVPGKGVISTISIDGKTVRGTTAAATIKAGKTSVIRYTARGLEGANSGGKDVYVTLTYAVGEETLSVRKSVKAQDTGPAGD